MKLIIKHQENYSRGELLLRTFFGWLYINLPHVFVLSFLNIWSGIITFISWWSILFTGRYPQSLYEYQVKLMKWGIRLNARILNLTDGYPSFGLDSTDEATDLQIEYPEQLSRTTLLLKSFFGVFYVGIPHGFMLLFRFIGALFIQFLAWWVVLFTGKYPESWHNYMVGTIRWMYRLQLYMNFMTDEYPPYTGKEIEAAA